MRGSSSQEVRVAQQRPAERRAGAEELAPERWAHDIVDRLLPERFLDERHELAEDLGALALLLQPLLVGGLVGGLLRVLLHLTARHDVLVALLRLIEDLLDGLLLQRRLLVVRVELEVADGAPIGGVLLAKRVGQAGRNSLTGAAPLVLDLRDLLVLLLVHRGQDLLDVRVRGRQIGATGRLQELRVRERDPGHRLLREGVPDADPGRLVRAEPGRELVVVWGAPGRDLRRDGGALARDGGAEALELRRLRREARLRSRDRLDRWPAHQALLPPGRTLWL